MASAALGNPQSNNLYAYVQNMPTDFVDPSGLLMLICVWIGWKIDTPGNPRVYVCFLSDFGGGGQTESPPIDSGGGIDSTAANSCSVNSDDYCNQSCLSREEKACAREGEAKFDEIFSLGGAIKSVIALIGVRTFGTLAAMTKAEIVAMVSAATWWAAGGAGLGIFLYNHTQTAVAVENACRKQIPKICGAGCKKYLSPVGRA